MADGNGKGEELSKQSVSLQSMNELKQQKLDKLTAMSSLESESDDSQEYASIPTSPGVEYVADHDNEHDNEHNNDYDSDETDDGSPDTMSGTEPKGKDKDTAKQDTFRVLVTGFGVSYTCRVIMTFTYSR